MPLFTVVIPTRNRPQLIAQSVASVIEQDFGDFELIVSDNSDPERAEQNRAQLAGLDRRLKYVRPDRVLSMREHWEWALAQAQGDYVGVLTDRMGFKLNALSRVKQALDALPASLVSFGNDSLEGDSFPYFLNRRSRSGRIYRAQADESLAEASRSKFSKFLPRMLNSFASRTMLGELRTAYGSVFTGIAPDYSFCFRALDHVDAYTVIDESLMVTWSASVSNGLAFTNNRPNEHSKDFIARYDDADRWIKFAPVPELSTPGVVVALEYEAARSQQKSGRFPPFDRAAYYKFAASEIVRLSRQGSALEKAAEAVEAYRRENSISVPSPIERERQSWGYRLGLREAKRSLRSFRSSAKRLAARSGLVSRTSGSPRAGEKVAFESLIDALRFEYKTSRLAGPDRVTPAAGRGAA